MRAPTPCRRRYGNRHAVNRDVAGFGQKLGANADRINKDLDAVAHRQSPRENPNRLVWRLVTPARCDDRDRRVFPYYLPAAA